MNVIKFVDDKGKIYPIHITQNKKTILFSGKALSRRAAFILARRKGWTHPKMVQQ